MEIGDSKLATLSSTTFRESNKPRSTGSFATGETGLRYGRAGVIDYSPARRGLGIGNIRWRGGKEDVRAATWRLKNMTSILRSRREVGERGRGWRWHKCYRLRGGSRNDL